MKRLSYVLLFLAGQLGAQDVLVLNPNHGFINLNPAFAGSNGGLRVQLAGQRLSPYWARPSLPVFVAADMYVPAITGGVSASYSFDGHPAVPHHQFSVSFGRHISLRNNSIRLVPAVNVLYGHKHAHDIWIDGGSGIPLYLESANKKYVSAGVGFLVQSTRGFTGGAFFSHLNQPDVGIATARLLVFHATLHGSYTMRISDRHLIQPLYRFSLQTPYSYHQLLVTSLLFRHIIAGVGVTSDEEISAQTGYRARFFSLSVYFRDVFRRSLYSAGTIEAGASFNLCKKEHARRLLGFEDY